MKKQLDLIQKTILHEHWTDMPEFIQEKQKPFAQIIVRFDSEKDLQNFSEIIGQKLTSKTKSIWHPYKSHFREIIKEWQDES
jgi:hypothetical protein